MRYIVKDSLLFQTQLSLSLSLCECVSRRTEPERSGRRGGDGGAKQVPEPRDAAALTTTPWCGIRREEE